MTGFHCVVLSVRSAVNAIALKCWMATDKWF